MVTSRSSESITQQLPADEPLKTPGDPPRTKEKPPEIGPIDPPAPEVEPTVREPIDPPLITPTMTTLGHSL